MPRKRFTDPPIVEVVCGVRFEPIDEIDPVLVGRFWESQLERFPKKQLLPALPPHASEGLVFELASVPPLRTWLISGDDSRIMQIQSDRFYLNWREMGSTYPSFNGGLDQPGLGTEFLEAFSSFATFLRDRASVQVQPQQIELSMIDVLKRGRYWGSVHDLGELVPLIRGLLGGFRSLPTSLHLAVEGPTENGERRVVVQRAVLAVGGAEAVRLETTIRRGVASLDELDSELRLAHLQAKDTFDELIPVDQHHRFEKGWSPQ